MSGMIVKESVEGKLFILIRNVEKITEPSREIDAQVDRLLMEVDNSGEKKLFANAWWSSEKSNHAEDSLITHALSAPFYTASIDAAMSIVTTNFSEIFQRAQSSVDAIFSLSNEIKVTSQVYKEWLARHIVVEALKSLTFERLMA